MLDILIITPTEVLTLNQEVNGTMILASKLLQSGFHVEILRFGQIGSYKKVYNDFIRDITNQILEKKPKALSFYTLWPYYHIMLRIAREIKSVCPDIIIVFGGPQASATANATLKAASYVDYICTGEGENTVVPFFNSVLRSNSVGIASLLGVCYRENDTVVCNENNIPLCDLNDLPYWDEHLYVGVYEDSLRNMQSSTYFMPIDAGRGCPYNCSFCCTSYFWRRTYRLKTPERIVQDIMYYNQKFGIKSFWFSHDAFTANRKLVANVCDSIIENQLDITWRCTSRIDCITEDLILKMKQAGMTHIELGIETGSSRMQKLIHKNLNLENAEKMVSFLLKNKIRVGLFFMYGFPEETEEDLASTLSLLFSLLDSGVSNVSMSFCSFNPMTEITEKHFEKLILDPNIKVLTRGVYGYQEELPVIQNNKSIFPFFYHLSTPVRNEYQYLTFLVHLYQQYPHSIKHLRQLYAGDDLRFYRDFYQNNQSYFENTMDDAMDSLKTHSLDMLYQTIKAFGFPYIKQLKALLRYDHDAQYVFHSNKDIALQNTYDFSYIDFKLNLPISQYSDGKTEILLKKAGGKASMKILGMK